MDRTRDLASLAGEETIFGGFAAEKLKRLQAELEPLSRRYDVVVANPPYMGSSNMNGWLSGWVKERFPDSKRDLCTCFIERGFGMLTKYGYSAMVTMESWMFLSSFERMRKNILHNHCIATMVYMNHMVMRIAFNTCATIFANHHSDSPGLYTKVEYQDLTEDGIPFEFPVKKHGPKHEKGALEALANPECGWFYRADASGFEAIPGSPIAYWVSKAEAEAFKCDALGEMLITREGMATADNDRFLRCWAEVGINTIGFGCGSPLDAAQSKMKWFPYQKGGEFRKWFGNNDFVVNWENDGFEIRDNIDPKTKRIRSHNYNGDYGFRESATWSALSSASIHVRYTPCGSLFDSKGAKGFAETTEKLMYSIALVNSSSAKRFLKFLAPTLDFKVGDVAKLPNPKQRVTAIAAIAEECVAMAKSDYDAFEESWDFSKHPLI